MIAARSAEDWVYEPINWLWKPFISYGNVTTIFSDYAIHATRLILEAAAHLTTGRGLPVMENGELKAGPEKEPEKVFYLVGQDMLEDTCIGIFRRAGGDDKRLLYLPDADLMTQITSADLEEAITSTDTKLLVVDTFEYFRPASVGLDDPAGLRTVFLDMQKLAQKTGTAIVLISDVTALVNGEDAFSWYRSTVSPWAGNTLMVRTGGYNSYTVECLKPRYRLQGEKLRFYLDDDDNITFEKEKAYDRKRAKAKTERIRSESLAAI